MWKILFGTHLSLGNAVYGTDNPVYRKYSPSVPKPSRTHMLSRGARYFTAMYEVVVF